MAALPLLGSWVDTSGAASIAASESDFEDLIHRVRQDQAHVDQIIKLATALWDSGVLFDHSCLGTVVEAVDYSRDDDGGRSCQDPAWQLGGNLLVRCLERCCVETKKGTLRRWWRQCLLQRDLEEAEAAERVIAEEQDAQGAKSDIDSDFALDPEPRDLELDSVELQLSPRQAFFLGNDADAGGGPSMVNRPEEEMSLLVELRAAQDAIACLKAEEAERLLEQKRKHQEEFEEMAAELQRLRERKKGRSKFSPSPHTYEESASSQNEEIYIDVDDEASLRNESEAGDDADEAANLMQQLRAAQAEAAAAAASEASMALREQRAHQEEAAALRECEELRAELTVANPTVLPEGGDFRSKGRGKEAEEREDDADHKLKSRALDEVLEASDMELEIEADVDTQHNAVEEGPVIARAETKDDATADGGDHAASKDSLSGSSSTEKEDEAASAQHVATGVKKGTDIKTRGSTAPGFPPEPENKKDKKQPKCGCLLM